MEIVEVNSNSVTLQWSPPRVPNGVITHYSILNNGTNIANFGNNMLMDTIEGLVPDAVYVLQLRAHTVVGAGPPSNITIVTCKLFVVVIYFIVRITYQYKLT